MQSPPKLIFANSEMCADLFYACRFFAPDPFAFVQIQDKKYILLSDLEIDRGRVTAEVTRVDSLSAWVKLGGDYAEGLMGWLRHLGVSEEVEVPKDFPLWLARRLEAVHFKLNVVDGNFWPERQWKTSEELAAISHALRITEAGMERGLEVLRAASILPKGQLKWGGKILTSERLRAEIDAAVLYQGGAPANTIVAGGEQACDPHERGYGPLFANQLIILDIFPRDPKSGYYGDMTRTVVRGRTSDAQRQLWETCLQGQEMALRSVAVGADGKEIHEQIQNFFAMAGYPLEKKNNRWSGFFHGTGHGLGLEIHEEPRFGAVRSFRLGEVVTVEPGLYIPGLGGVRHEDVITITEQGNTVLTQCKKPLEI